MQLIRYRSIKIMIILLSLGLFALAQPTLASSSEIVDPEASHFLTVQAELSDLGFYRGDLNGKNNSALKAAVLAFHKATGAERTRVWERLDWLRADLYVQLQPSHLEDRMDIDLANQVAYVMSAGDVQAVLGISSGNGGTYPSSSGGVARATTPTGEFTFERHIDGWRRARLGSLYKPWYFEGGFAVHGSNSVPGYPASHGCVRVTIWDADWLSDFATLGMKVSIFDGEAISDILLSLVATGHREFF
jgi:hypothetical protein